ncbi:MAG: hypothetical protein ABIC40_03475, partial [bacterium]
MPYMIRIPIIIVICLSLVFTVISCKNNAGIKKGTPCILQIEKSDRLATEYETIQVTEVGRFTPPDNIVWPSALGFENQTIWWWGENGPILFTGCKSEKPRDEAEGKGVSVPAKVFTWDLESGKIDSHALDPQPVDSPGFF